MGCLLEHGSTNFLVRTYFKRIGLCHWLSKAMYLLEEYSGMEDGVESGIEGEEAVESVRVGGWLCYHCAVFLHIYIESEV